MMQGIQSQCSVPAWRDGVGREVGRVFRKEGTCVYLQPIHVDVWQNIVLYFVQYHYNIVEQLSSN